MQVWTPTGVEIIPGTDLDEAQMRELQQLLDGLPTHVIDVSDPEADALLEATDPAVEHGPAELLERAVNQEAKATFQQAVEEELPQEQEEDGAQAELLDMEQAPRQLFRDVEAAPVKVGEVVQIVLPVTDSPLLLRTRVLRKLDTDEPEPLYAARFIDLCLDEEVTIRKAVFSIQVSRPKAKA